MNPSQFNAGQRKPEHEVEWDRSERRSTWIALTIALMPIPVSLAISWTLGSPPWRDRSAQPTDEPSVATPHVPESTGHGHP